MNWSKWEFFKNVNKLPKVKIIAVYQIRCLSRNLKPISIFRACGKKDKAGIIDIGQTNNLRIWFEKNFLTLKITIQIFDPKG